MRLPDGEGLELPFSLREKGLGDEGHTDFADAAAPPT